MKRLSALIPALFVVAAACGDIDAAMEPATATATTATTVSFTEPTDVTFTTADGLTWKTERSRPATPGSCSGTCSRPT